MQKKSQVSTQFNWIFVLIVGGMFLLIFFTMSNRQSSAADTRISAIALAGISTIFESARTGTSLSTVVNVPDIDISFTCQSGLFGNNIYSDYRVGGLSRRIPALPTFAPGTLRGTNLITWTVSWDMPFKIMNFLFLANSRTRFFFYFPDDQNLDFKQTINETFSRNIYSIITDTTEDLDFYNDLYSIIVIFADDATFNSLDKGFLSRFDNDVRVIQVIPDDDFRFGNIKYRDGAANLEGESIYFGLASFYGAVFSPDKEYYECSMKKALKRFERISCVYKQKYQLMRQTYVSNPNCDFAYNNALQAFNNLFGDEFCVITENTDPQTSEEFPNTIDLNSPTFSFESYIDYKNFFDDLSTQNRQTIVRSCELLY